MAFLSSFTTTGSVAVSNTSKKQGNASKSEDYTATSMWQAFQDRLYNNTTEPEPVTPTKSFFFLNHEMKRVESKAAPSNPTKRRSSASSLGSEDNGLFLSKEMLKELEETELNLPDRWLDYFCIVGIEPGAQLVKDDDEGSDSKNTNDSSKSPNKPILLDRYPKESHSDMEFPEHLPTFCFPNGGCKPLRYKKPKVSVNSDKKKSPKGNKTKTTTLNFHHNAPEPSLCSTVLTSASGHRLYCTALTVYEMREEEKPDEKDREETIEIPKEQTEQEDKDPRDSIPVDLDKNWWEEPTIDSMTKNIEEKRKLQKGGSNITAGMVRKGEKTANTDVEYYWMVPKSLVVISHYPFFQAQWIVLQELFYTVQSGLSPIPFERYVAHLVDDIPLPRSIGGNGTRSKSKNTVAEWTSWIAPPKSPPTLRLERPPPNRLPLLSVSMEPLFRTLSLSNILVLWGTLLKEGKVVLACSSSDTTALLTPIAESLLSLLFPLEWQGIYIPVLPTHESVMDVLEAPVPYLIGLATDSKYDKPRNQPGGVLWCDLDNDTLHLGFTEDHTMYFNQHRQEDVPLLPALPSDASMRLKAELEEIADPLFLPTFEGIKGRVTVGDRTIELDNALRQPYAQRTKLFGKPMPTPRKYILTQSSKIPPREKAVTREDFCMLSQKKSKTKIKSPTSKGKKDSPEEMTLCGLTLDDIQIPCADDTTITESQDETEEPKVDEKEKSQESSQFMMSLKRQSRSMQAHVDRAMAVLGQDYATPSRYVSCNFGDDMLGQQDAIAASFFSLDSNEQQTITVRVRESFLRFFLTIFANYQSHIDSETGRFDVAPFLRNLGLAARQREYITEVVTSQMFERFLHDTTASSILQKHRRLFDEYIVLHKTGDFHLRERTTLKALTKQTGTPLLNSSQWRHPSVLDAGRPCAIGVKKGRGFCQDRRFPDCLDPEECVTKKSISTWRAFLDGALCGAFCSCL